MPEPLVSVIIPSYNHQNFIGRAIESVLKQTYEKLEIVIIDDGSKDNSPDIIRNYHDPRIKFIEQENHGAHNTINRGLNMALGEYLCILNSDDEFHSDRIKQMLDRLIKDENPGLACSYIQVIDSRGRILGVKEGPRNLDPWPMERDEITFKAIDCLPLNLLMSNFISTTSNMFFHRSIWEAVGPFRNLRYAHDWDFAFRCADHAPISLVPEPLVRYRVHHSNTIRENKSGMVYEIIWVLAENLHRYNKKDIIQFNKPEDLGIFAERFHNSLYLYDCDKEFITVLWMIQAAQALGHEEFNETLLDENNPVRQYILKMIQKKLDEKPLSNIKEKMKFELVGFLNKLVK